jgi:hypothetical protein
LAIITTIDQAEHHQHGLGFADVAAGVDDVAHQVAERP